MVAAVPDFKDSLTGIGARGCAITSKKLASPIGLCKENNGMDVGEKIHNHCNFQNLMAVYGSEQFRWEPAS